jgi:phosphate acetyltransferase/phosphate butyryltransferase
MAANGDAPRYLENKTFAELRIGDIAELTRTLCQKDIQLFAVMSGDVNPAHLDEEYAKSDLFHKIVAHGMWGGALISTVLGTLLPGPGTIYLGQTLRFNRPVALGDAITVTVKVADKAEHRHRVIFDCSCVNQRGEAVISGQAEVIAPTEKVRRLCSPLPQVRLYDPGARYRELIAMTAGLAPVVMAVAHPVDAESLQGAVEAGRERLIVPILVGPIARIRAAAESAGIDLAGIEIVDAAHSHEAAAKAVALCRSGRAEALMKGALHTDELMHEVVAAPSGLGTGRHMSHVFVMDVPAFPRRLFITDAAINIAPDLDDKRDIVQNAIDLAQALGLQTPRVALLSAVETVTPKIRSTLECAALCKMAERGQIAGGLLDGPLAFDNAVSEDAARIKGLASPVAGNADILVVPDLEAGNMLAKQLTYLAQAQAAGIVLGARVPIVLTSRADGTLARKASCAVALLVARHRQAAKP